MDGTAFNPGSHAAVEVAEKAQRALPGWSALGPGARRELIARAADSLGRLENAFVEAMVEEIGATPGWARCNLQLAGNMLREAAALKTQIAGEIIPSDKPGCLAMSVREPAGVAIIRACDESHAIELANDSDYGLSAAVFTHDIACGLKVAKAIKSGICHSNGPTVHDEAQMPFGGVKSSGYGRFGGKAGMDAFTELRWITSGTSPGYYPI